MKKILFLIATLSFFCTQLTFAIARDPYTFSNPSEEQRFRSLITEIRCVVCQNQNIADSNAPLANDLRGKIYFFIQENKSDTEIKNYLIKRYGEFILLEPRLNTVTAFLWFFPSLGILAAFILLILFLKKENSLSRITERGKI